MRNHALVFLTMLVPGVPALAGDATDYFETSVRPLLVDRCYKCHSADAKRPKADLRLDTKDGVLKGGRSGPAVVPGDPDASLLVKAIRYQDKDLQMPPAGPLDDAEVAVLATWVKMGAPDPRENPLDDALAAADRAPEKQTTTPPSTPPSPPGPPRTDHWSFRPIADPPVPSPKDASRARNDVDRFVLAGLEAENLALAPEADRATLLRRLSFVLTGLPPSPADVDQFVADPAPDAFERQVDRMLASTACAERLARAWLDVARYADSNGLDENLAMSNAWRYRDWVVEAYRRDLPFDRFVTEQLAGDLVPERTGETEAEKNGRVTATGFLVLGPKMLAEQDKEKLKWDTIDEQLDVTGKALLGLTFGCARCHDHKFDPILQKDYAALAGIFASTKSLANVEFVSRWNERELPTRAAAEAKTKHDAELAAKRDEAMTLEKAANDALVAALAPKAPAIVAAVRTLAPRVLSIEAEDASRTNLVVDDKQWGDAQHKILRTGMDGDQFVEFDLVEPAARRVRVFVRQASAESRPMSVDLNGVRLCDDALATTTGGFFPDRQRFDLVAEVDLLPGKNVLRLARAGAVPHLDRLLIVPAESVESNALRLEIAARFEDLERAAASGGAALGDDAAIATALAADADGPFGLSRAEREPMYEEAARVALDAARMAVDALEKNPPAPFDRALAVEDASPVDVPVFTRGNHLAPQGDAVPRGFPAVFAERLPAPQIAAGASGRAEFARWVTDPRNPLTARVQANRLFALAFGRGLVRSPSNFGIRGEAPTHPELLDWLARRFVEGGWSTRALLRTLVLSSAWRAQSSPSADATERDPDNRLLSHANRRRLEAEWLRDALLAASGRLDPTCGGSLLATKNGDYVTNDQSKDVAAYAAPRRSIYLPVVRNSLFEMFATFDFGDPSTPLEQRGSTTTAGQALWLMNSPMMQETAAAIAERSKADGADDAARLDRVWRACLQRTPSDVERDRCKRFVADVGAASAPADPWALVVQAVLASNDFLYVE